MTPAIKGGLEKLIAAIDERRALMERWRVEILSGEPTSCGATTLLALKKQLDHLQLAEDVLADALSAVERIDPDQGENAA